jgi:TRAP-type C4-dicarboxylate transport system permease small subunit
MEDESGIPHRRPAGSNLADRAMHAIETAALAVSMLAIVFAALIIFLTVTGRTFVGRSIPDSVILAENLMPIIVTLPLAYVAARRGHIEVEVFTNFLPPRGILVLTMLGNLVGLIVFGLIAWSAWNVLGRDWATGRFYEGVLRIPQWPAKAFFVAGLALFGLRLALNFVEDALKLFRRGAPSP